MKSICLLILPCVLFLGTFDGAERHPVQHWFETVECETLEEFKEFQQFAHSAVVNIPCAQPIRTLLTATYSTYPRFDKRLFILQQSLRI